MIPFESLPSSFVFYLWEKISFDYCPRYKRCNDLEEYGISSDDFWNQHNDEAYADVKDYWETYDDGCNSQMALCTNYIKHTQNEIARFLADISVVQTLSHQTKEV